MLTPIDFSRLSGALASQIYWLELALVLACIAFAWAIDRRLEARARLLQTSKRHPRISGGVGRIVFSLVALALLFIVRPSFRAFGGPPFFIDIAIPLLIALAIIRMLVYVMRSLFAESAWVKTSERRTIRVRKRGGGRNRRKRQPRLRFHGSNHRACPVSRSSSLSRSQ